MFNRKQVTFAFTAVLLSAWTVSAQTGPVAAYSFDQGTGAVATDSSGNNHNAAISGATWSATGKNAGALQFDGVNDILTVADTNLLDLTTGMTLEAWVRPAAAASWRTVVLKERGAGLSYALYSSNDAGRPSGWVRRTSDIDTTSTSALPLNTWTHLALTYDGATLRLFVNATQVSSRAVTGAIVTSTGALRIGGNTVWSEFFNGTIDDVRVYNRALTAAQIQTDSVTPVGGGTPTPTWTISGTITPTAAGVGAQVSLAGPVSGSVAADATGTFSFGGLSDGAYALSAAKGGWTFAPAALPVVISGGNVSGANFAGTAAGPDVIPPSGMMTSPVTGATLSGTVQITANASDNVAVGGVQFLLDGASLGAEDTVAPYGVSWNSATAANGAHTLTATVRDTAGLTFQTAAVAVTVANGTSPAVIGQWSPSFDIGMVAVNMVLMHTGKVLMFSGDFTQFWTERVWDPSTGSITLRPNPYYNLFCAGQSQLADGRILVVGGYDPGNFGARNANIFNPATETWSALPNMAYRRWYPTSTTLPDGRALVMSGAQTCLTCLADVPEIYDPVANTFTTLPTARLAVPYYPFMYVLPDGRVVDAGANENPTETRTLDLTTRTWSMVDPATRDGHTSAMYRPGKIFKSGTAADSGTAGSAAATAYVIDMTQSNPTWRQVASMAFPRAFHNSTILPDGNVLITGGGTMLDGYDVSKAVYEAELWSPTSETFQTLARAAIPRLYHSTALLLPDGRVLMAGSGNDGPAVNQLRAELYSPPYLFKGQRPTLSSAPDLIQYNGSFTVQTPDAADIASVALIRPGSVTHSFDEDQRFLNLSFTAGAGILSIEAPANGNLAPPGYYMLFIVNSNGVPSVARFVRLPAPSSDTSAPIPPTSLSATGGLGTIDLAWTPSTDNVGVAHYNVHRATTPGFAPSAANRIGQSVNPAYTDSGLAPGSFFYLVTAQDVAGNISAPSNEANAIAASDTTPPTVTITAPTSATTVSGTISLTATASDNVGVAGVQFRLDGVPLGTERTTAPYTLSWNTATTSNATHVLTATARDAAGNQRVSAEISVVVSNIVQTPTGLVAAYGFNESSGTTATDSSGSGNNGTVSGATRSASGRFGSALSFNGTSNWVTVPDSPTLDLSTGLTIEAWVNPSTVTGWRTVVLKEAGSNLSYALYSGNNAQRPGGWFSVNGSDYAVTGTANIVANTWTHLAFTYDGTTLRLFVNGVQASTLTGPAAIPSNGVLRIGGNAVWGEYFRGLIDEVRIYNRALSGAEIQTDMNSAVGGGS